MLFQEKYVLVPPKQFSLVVELAAELAVEFEAILSLIDVESFLLVEYLFWKWEQ